MRANHTSRVALLAALTLVATACGDSAESTTTTPPPAETPTTIAAPTTTTVLASTTTTTVPLATTTSMATTTTVDPVAACRAYSAELAIVLTATSAELEAGADISGDLADGVISEAEGADLLEAVADAMAGLSTDLEALGGVPPLAQEAAAIVAESVSTFEEAFRLQAQGARAGDAALIDQGTELLNQGAALLEGFGPALESCQEDGAAETDAEAPPATLAEPDEVSIEVYLRTAESVLADGPYAGTGSEALIAGGQAACLALIGGNDLRDVILAALAETPAAGKPIGGDEQGLALLLVNRGTTRWCPDLIDDADAFAADVVSAIVDIIANQ